MRPKNKNIASGKRALIFVFGAMVTFVVFGAAFFSVAGIFGNTRANENGLKMVAIPAASAHEMYGEFLCSCCSKPLDPDNPCCGDMLSKIQFVDDMSKNGASREEVLMAGAKKFGFNSLAKEETRNEVKAKFSEQAPKDAPKITLTENRRDIGEVRQSNGVITALFDVQNTGKSDLVIKSLTTSCGCTSAAIVYEGKEGPTFTMPGHGKENPKNWSVSIRPGDSAVLKVYYDPNAHGVQKEDVLPVTRTVSIFSNDPIDFEKQIRIDLTQKP